MPRKRAQLWGIIRGQGLVITLRAWSGRCAMQASASGVWECAVVAVHVSLRNSLNSATVDLLGCRKNNK